MSYRAAWLLVPLMLYTLLLSPHARSGELRPLNLPSTQQPQMAPVPAPVVTPAPAKPSVYDQFRQDIAGLSESEKQEYRDSFQSSLTQAKAERNWAAAAYYQELLNILGPGGN